MSGPRDAAFIHATRRRFLAVGAASGALLAVAGWWSLRPGGAAPGYRALGKDGVLVSRALIPAILEGALPAADPERETAIRHTLEALDRAIAGLSPAVQAEIAQLFALLGLAPGRWLLAGVRPRWADASTEEAAAFLRRWKDGRIDLMRAGYQALTQLVIAACYGSPLSWAAIGYPGAPRLSRP